jgi:outer membrane protein OmpA-like peptidoglycan-associated protein
LFVTTRDGKEFRVQTPLGEAVVSDAEARVQFDGKTVSMRVQRGEGTFIADGITTPVQEFTTFEKTAEKKSIKLNYNKKVEPPVPILEATRNTIPGRWDPAHLKKFQAEIMRLDSVPGLKLGEYVRDAQIRNELKLKIYDLLNKQAELREMQTGLANDVLQFEELKKTLSATVEEESEKTARERAKHLRQASRILARAQSQLRDIKENLEMLMKEIRSNQEYLANMPIVRLLNVTAEESTVPFEPGRAVLSETAIEVLDIIADSTRNLQPYRIVVEGHTDQSGSEETNLRLSKLRAEAVAGYLRKKTNLPPRVFMTLGRGATQPLVSGDDIPAAMQKNRRVEIWFELRGL